MIDVPIAVRDALKDGGYKKNYRIEVGSVTRDHIYADETPLALDTPYTLINDGNYRIYGATRTMIEYKVNGGAAFRVSVDGDDTYGYYCDFALKDRHAGDTITLTSSSYDMILKHETDDTQEIYRKEFDINNDNLVKESVKIDERMCSDDNLKFGLCEGSEIEFQAFDIENITGKRVQVFVDVDYPVYTYEYDATSNKTTKIETIETYPIPMGWFDVHETSRQASTGNRKISAYNKLKSEYLDADAKALIQTAFGIDADVYVMDILRLLLKHYGIKEPEYQKIQNDTLWNFVWSNARQSFRPFHYSRSQGTVIDHTERTPMNAAILMEQERITTSTNIYVEGNAYLARYRVKKNVGNLPIQIDVDSAVPYMDSAIADYIQGICDGILTDVGGTELWNRIRNMKTSWSPTIYNYFFYVYIHFVGGNEPDQIFGNNLVNPTGTFADLANRTFTNVDFIEIVTPYRLRYGHKFVANTYDPESLQYFTDGRADNDIYCVGAPREYVHHFGDEYEYSTYTPPKMPDGTNSGYLHTLFTVKTLAGNVSPSDLLVINTGKLSNITLRDLQTAVFETECQFGKLDRTNNYFTGVELNYGRLYPMGDDEDPSAEALYPADDLYPMSDSESGFRAMYSKLWADEGNVHKWRSLIITYKGLAKDPDTQEVSEADKIYQITINAGGTDDYEITNNWLFKNLIWADSETEEWAEAAGLENIEDYATAMVAKMQPVQWFPFEMWCAGLPYVETGDEIEINIAGGAYSSYVLRRTIKGIQNLQDEMIDGTLDIF